MALTCRPGAISLNVRFKIVYNHHIVDCELAKYASSCMSDNIQILFATFNCALLLELREKCLLQVFAKFSWRIY